MYNNQDYITQVRAETRIVWEVIQRLKNMQPQWDALDYGNTLGDGEGENLGITVEEVGAMVFDTTNMLYTAFFGSGHKTNAAKLL